MLNADFHHRQSDRIRVVKPCNKGDVSLRIVVLLHVHRTNVVMHRFMISAVAEIESRGYLHHEGNHCHALLAATVSMQACLDKTLNEIVGNRWDRYCETH